MTPPPFVATFYFMVHLRTSGLTTIPARDDFPLELRLKWSIMINGYSKEYHFPEGYPVDMSTMLRLLEPQDQPVVFLDHNDEDPSETVFVEIREHDTRTIAWYHQGIRGLVKSGYGLNEASSWEELPNPIYFRKLHNKHIPETVAMTVSSLARAFPGRLYGDYTKKMHRALSIYLNEDLPNPGPHVM